MWATVRRYEGVTDPGRGGTTRGRRLRAPDQWMRGSSWPTTGSMPGRRDGFHQHLEDRSHEEESNEKAASWVHENLSEVLPNPPTITAGHVVAQA